MIGAFLLQKILENGGGLDRGELVAALGLSREGLAAGRVWQPLTSLLLHANLAHALVNALGLWVFGSVVESRRGPGTTLLVFLVGGLAGGAAFLGWGALAGDAGGATVVIGASGGASALLAASVLAAPRETVVLFGIVPTPLWLVGALFLGTDVARILTGARDGVAVETHLGGAAAGACLHAWARRRGAARLRAPSVGRGDAARGAAARRPDFHRLGADDAEAARVDLLLERIHADGIAALTDEEREFLRRVSERLRGRPRG